MEYIDIIRDNIKNHSPVNWWPKFAFHYTDVTNAASILSSGYLYSRANATHLRVMKNDNASRQVIDMTSPSVTSNVRFYFRPLTPTQYYNEGYKHTKLRYSQDKNANVPVPVFFLFKLDKLLSLPGIQFSEISQAGHGAKLCSGIEAFSKLNFDYIYDNSYENFDTTKTYRHAEILHPDSMKIDSSLSHILCRNSIDRTTLLNLLLQSKNLEAFKKYHPLIKVYNQDTFECNGIFITECTYLNNKISISFSDTYASKRYIERMLQKSDIDYLNPIKVTLSLQWGNPSVKIIDQKFIETTIDARNPEPIILSNILGPKTAKYIRIQVYFDDKLMCYIVQSLNHADILE